MLLRRFTVIFLMLTSVLSGCSSLQAQTKPEDTAPSAEFLNLFEAELQNRALARTLTKQLASSTDNPEWKAFWSAYHELESKNYRLYKPIAEQYNLSPEASLRSRSKAWFSKIAFQTFPETMAKKIHKAVIEYQTKLMRLQAIGPGDISGFLQWVVDQEQAQEEAFALITKGKILEATIRLNQTAAMR